MAAAKTKKRTSTKTTDAELNALAKKVRKDPKAATKAERRKVVNAKLVAAGLTGKARQVFIDTGKTSKEQTKPRPKAKRASSTGVMPIHEAIQKALLKGAMDQKELVDKVSKLRGRETSAGTVRPYLTDKGHSHYRQNKDGKWALAK